MRTQTIAPKQMSSFLPSATEFPGVDPLSPEEGTSFSDDTRGQDAAKSRDELILEHLPTVRFVARRVFERVPQHVEFEDLVSAGLVGLIDAAAKFDGSKQIQFKSYAQFRIRGAILDSLRMLDWSPRELRRKGRAMAEAIRVLSSRLGRTPGDSEIALEMEMDLLTFQQMTGELKGLEVGSLNLDRTEEVGEEELDFVPAPAADNPLSICIEGQTREQLAEAIEALPEKERLVLTLYYFEEMTMKEIGLTLGVVESRVSQIRSSAIARLRTKLTARPSAPASKGAKKKMH